jgi:sulfonate transport system substrate-binding protein
VTIVAPIAFGHGDIKSGEAGQQALETLIEPRFAQQSAS